MRLDFRNVGKGLEAIAGAKQKRDLARESARYDITEGAYGPELGENVQQVIGMRDQALQGLGEGATPEQRQQVLDQYTPALTELSRRTGLQGPDFSVGSREANFGTRQEARQAAAPMRAEGLSNVYRQYGDVEEADELEARAFDQQRGLAQETRAQARFKTQQEAADLQLEKARRSAEADARMSSFDAWTAENPGADLAAMKNAAKEFKLSSDQVLSVTARMAGLQDNELKLWKGEVQNLLKGRSDAEIVDLFNNDDRFDPTTDMERKVGKDGSVTLTLKRKDGTVVSTYKAPDAATATTYLRKLALEPETLADWLLGRKKTEAQIAASERSNRGGGTPSLSQKIAATETALGRKLTDEEKSILVGLTSRPGLGSDKPVEVQEAGIRVMVGGQLMVTDGDGGYVAPGGVVPAERTAFLQDAGVNDNLINQIDWSPDGLTVGYGGKQYDPKNRKDMNELNNDFRRLGVNTTAVEEAQRMTPAEQARIRSMYTDPMYASP